jgi:hypothetical protein
MRARGLTPALTIGVRYTESDSCISCARWSVDGPYSGGVAGPSPIPSKRGSLALSLESVACLSLVMRRCSTASWPTPLYLLFWAQPSSPPRESFLVLITLFVDDQNIIAFPVSSLTADSIVP